MDMSALHPNLAVSDARAAIDDVITAGAAIIHSDLRLPTTAGFSTFTVAQEFPGAGSTAPDPDGPTSVSFTVPVPDTDAAYARAVAAGATSTAEPADWFEGFRQAAVRCPFGPRWYFVTVADSVTPDDVQRASDAWMSEQPTG